MKFRLMSRSIGALVLTGVAGLRTMGCARGDVDGTPYDQGSATGGRATGSNAATGSSADDGADTAAPGDTGMQDQTVADGFGADGAESGPETSAENADAREAGATPDAAPVDVNSSPHTDTAPAEDAEAEAAPISDAYADAGFMDADTAAADSEADVRMDADTAAADSGADVRDEATCSSQVLTIHGQAASSELRAASKATDGNFGTRWESNQGVDPQWIYVDLGATVFIDRVRIDWENSCARSYDLQMSDVATDDAGAWKTMLSVANNTAGGGATTGWPAAVVAGNVADHMGLSGVGRYLRIFGKTRCSMYGYSIYEIEVSGDANATCSP